VKISEQKYQTQRNQHRRKHATIRGKILSITKTNLVTSMLISIHDVDCCRLQQKEGRVNVKVKYQDSLVILLMFTFIYKQNSKF
jgi:hypothetical protein